MGREAERDPARAAWRTGPLVLVFALGVALHLAPGLALHLGPGLRARAEAGSDVPGADAVFAGRGVAIVWGMVRGADADSADVVIWIASRDPAIRAVSVNLLDAAGGERLEILPPSLIGKAREARAPRARFTAYPRAELRFAAAPDALGSGAAALTVSYTGIPATTPEFSNEEALAEYLESALARATGG